MLAICVGMQALMARSEENDGVECLGTIPGEVRYFGEQHRDANGERLKVPHMAGMKSVPASLIPSGKIFRRVRAFILCTVTTWCRATRPLLAHLNTASRGARHRRGTTCHAVSSRKKPHRWINPVEELLLGRPMLVIPAIDLKEGQCVRLRQGDMTDSTVFSNDPVAMAERWQAEGARRLHIVDLDGAFAGEPVNAGIIEAISRALPTLPIQIGGGIRHLDTISRYFDAVQFAIIGTMAAKNPALVHDACQRLDQIIVGIDARAAGWQWRAGPARASSTP